MTEQGTSLPPQEAEQLSSQTPEKQENQVEAGWQFCHRELTQFFQGNEFADLAVPEASEERLEQRKQQLMKLVEIVKRYLTIRSNTKITTLSEALFFHDVGGKIHIIRGYCDMWLEDWKLLAEEKYRAQFLGDLNELQNGIEKLLEILEGIDPETGEIIIKPEFLSNLTTYIEKTVGITASNDMHMTEEERREMLSPLTMGEKLTLFLIGELENVQRNLLEKRFPQISFTYEKNPDLTPKQRAELEVYFNTFGFIHVFENAVQNVSRVLMGLLEESGFRLDIDPLFKVTAKETTDGLFIVLEDDAGGFPINESTVFRTSAFDGAECIEYIPQWGQTEYKGSNKGEGTATAGLVEMFKKMAVQTEHKLKATPYIKFYSVVDDKKSGALHGRVEVFVPFVQKEFNQQPANQPKSESVSA